MSQIGIGSFKYFIAIDFGTHGSGFAYSSAADSDSAVRTFEYWPGQRGSPAPKTRTALLYKRTYLSKPQAWGWEAITMFTDLPEEERANFILLESFKLYLMPEEFQDLPQLPAGLSVRKLIADYLSCLLVLINSTLEAHYGNRYRPSAVRWCLTVPAGLSQHSMTIMREAAMEAGIIPSLQSPALKLATEPEAAALAAQQRKDLLGLTAGGKFMIIDMGGGTVDMTIHRVDSVMGQEMALSEVTHRECLPEGATRVDKRFLNHLTDYLGEESYKEWADDVSNAEDWQDLVYNEWETCKCAYDITGSNSTMQVSLPYSLVWSVSDEARDTLEATGQADKLLLSEATMSSFFRPSLDNVATRALQMLARASGADIIVLVGGFSSSRYAMRTLRAALEVAGRAVVTPIYSRSAVLEAPDVWLDDGTAWQGVSHDLLSSFLQSSGGVWFARYPTAIAARCSNMTYGIRVAVPWKQGAPSKVFVPNIKEWLQHRLAYRCFDGFCRYVSKDELVKTGSIVSHNFVPLYPNQTGVEFDIFGSLAKQPRYTTEDTMVKVASVRVNIPPGSYTDPEYYHLTAHFSFGEAQISVRCVDEQTGQERNTVLLFDSSEVTRENLMSMAA